MRLPNGYGGVSKLSGRRRRPWIVRITTDMHLDEHGKPVQTRKTLGYFDTRAHALQALAEYNNNPYDLDMSALTFSEIYEYWSADKYKRAGNSSVKCYKAAYKHCEPLYDTVFKNLHAKQLQDFLDDTETNYATRQKILSLLNQLFKYAIANDITDKNYAEYVRNDADKPEPDREPFTENEIKTLKKIADTEPYADTILIMIYTGWRIGELLEIQRENVDIERWTMRGGLKTEAGKNRIVPVHECIRPYVKKYYDMGADTLIPKISYTAYRNYFDDICEKYGMRHRPHDCRHTFATRADNVGMNKVCIQRLMGHASENITDKVYTHKDIEELRKAIAMLP